MPEPDPLPPLREVISRFGLTARKSLGQNFLLDLNLTRRIARAAGPFEGTTVYEVGPGPGGLTRALLAEGAYRIVAIERDTRCLAALQEIAAAFPGKLETVSGDALAIDELALLREHNAGNGIRIAANLPYNIGTALLVKWLTAQTWPPWWQSLTLMFQREVAQRLVAEPKTPAYGRLSVLAQWRTRTQILFDVHPRAFTPPPKVTSAVVRLEPLSCPRAPADISALETVTGAAFGQRRKMLRQSLKVLLADTETLLQAAAIAPTARAEELSVVQFAALARAWRQTHPLHLTT